MNRGRGSRYWTVDELAEYLAVPRSWIYERTRAEGPDRIPHLKLGKYVRFDPDSPEFQSWLDDHMVATSDAFGSTTQRRP